MDAAYVKFMMCQCLMNRADWGLAVGCINVVYSFFLFIFWVVELVNSLASEYYPLKWVLLYGFNVMFNVITMMRIVERECVSVFYWMCETGALLMFRIYHIYYHEDDFWLVNSGLFRISNIVIDSYIGLSMLAMIYVMSGLHLDSEVEVSEEEVIDDRRLDPQPAGAKTTAQKDMEKVFEKENEKEQKLTNQNQLENIPEMKELHYNEIHKLADLVDQGSLQTKETTSVFDPTAPDEEKASSEVFHIHEIP
ncbi:uncharacterized protein LOC108038395 [Drosophila rhopaloa]|uniref:Uncharacterized protein LOC108038395 n=1 Tax=Drosophila rhopaloa TaxID=1041015 RepID=A0A6P4E5W2_DRORH|nr:uncharacterized protein LOC108038395 [Drosophila rhopaloa]